MKFFLLSATYLVGIGELILAIYFLVTNSRNEIRRVMALLAFSTGAWALTSAYVSYRAMTGVTEIISGTIFVFGFLLLTSLLHLAIVFPYKTFDFDRLHTFFLYVPVAVVTYLAIFTKTIAQGFDFTLTTPGIVNGGPLYPLYNVIGAILYLMTLLILAKKLNRTDGIIRKNILLVLWSFIIAGAPAVLIDLIVPLISKIYINSLLANISTVFWLGMTTYIVRRS